MQAPTGTGEVAWSYLVLGVEHILGGIDHLLFVLALLLIVRGGKRIIVTITAFTVAHSITLAAATLGWVHVPGPPVEAMIALSIVFVAAEIVRGLRGTAGPHGARALGRRVQLRPAARLRLRRRAGEVGLPQKAIPVALLMFNVGVELGQLLFVAAALALARCWPGCGCRAAVDADYAAPYAIGTVAMFWVIERIGAFA